MSSRVAAKRRDGRLRRHRRVRSKVMGSGARPRLAVFRSLRHIYAQVIDDRAGTTLVAASSVEPTLAADLEGKSKREQAALVGKAIGERAKGAGITAVVFDRGGYNYHGRVRELANAARATGLEF